MYIHNTANTLLAFTKEAHSLLSLLNTSYTAEPALHTFS
jgi:hypothetical protein